MTSAILTNAGIRFRKNTYIIYNGQKYPLEVVNIPFQTSTTKDSNYIYKDIHFNAEFDVMIMLVFPVKMQKGDSFDLVAYSNNKETKEIVSFKDIIIE